MKTSRIGSFAGWAVLSLALLAPAAAEAHVTVHPNVVPAGAYVTLNVRVPGEEDGAYADKVAMRMPPGLTSVDTENVPGWSVEEKTKKLAKPLETSDGPVGEEVSEVIWTGDGSQAGRLPAGTFVQFPLTVAIPESAAGRSLTFKALQYYSNGKVARWIGAPSADYPAPTIAVTAKEGVIEDVTGTPPSAVSGATPQGSGESSGSDGSSDALAIIALVLGALGLLAGGAALVIARRAVRAGGAGEVRHPS
jgi:uncharacterized protein YcnI